MKKGGLGGSYRNTGNYFYNVRVDFFNGWNYWNYKIPRLFLQNACLTKADNVGFGFIVLGGIIYYHDIFVTLKLILLWFLVIIGSATFSYLLVTKLYQRDREG